MEYFNKLENLPKLVDSFPKQTNQPPQATSFPKISTNKSEQPLTTCVFQDESNSLPKAYVSGPMKRNVWRLEHSNPICASLLINTHRIHGTCVFTYFHLHLVDFYGINVGKYTRSHGSHGVHYITLKYTDRNTLDRHLLNLEASKVSCVVERLTVFKTPKTFVC